MRFSPPCSSTPSTSLRCGGSSGAVLGTSRRLETAFLPLPNSPRRRIRRRDRDLACTALFDGLFGKQKASAATASPVATKRATQSPAPKFPEPPATAEDGSALPPPYHETVLLTRPCPSGDGGTVYLVYCAGEGGGDDAEGRVEVDAGALEALCDAVGWPRRPADAVEAALRGSFVVASLFARKVSGPAGPDPTSPPPPSPADQLVGLARATSDRAFNATIWDVLVHPEWQGLGLGSALVERTTAALLAAGVGNVTLFAASDAVEFYEALGYEADPDGIRGMFYAGK